MGGDRKLQLWLEKPSYLHSPRSNDRNWPSGKPISVDMGWTAPSRSIEAKPLINQDEALRKKIWEQVLLSCAPKGMASVEQAIEFAHSTAAVLNNDSSPTWRDLFTNRQWEDECNTAHKRFLLEIDLRSNHVQRIIPAWSGRGADGHEWHTSDQMGSMSASEYYHPEEESDGIPF